MNWGIEDFIAAGILIAILVGGIMLALRLKRGPLVRYGAVLGVVILVLAAWAWGAVGTD